MKKKVEKQIICGRGIVLDDESGEILAAPESDNYEITVKQFLDDEFEEETERDFMTDTTFIKSFRGNGVMLKKELTANEIATLVFLMDFISYKDCVLRKNGDYRGKALDIHDLAEMLDVKYDTLRRTMYSLRDKEVLGFHTTGTQGNSTNWITVNPFIFCRGMKLSVWVIEFFANTRWANLDRQYSQKSKRGMS